MREPYPSETQDRFMVRLPDGMRDKIKAAAEAANRTMNGEIVARLEASFREDFGVPDFVTLDLVEQVKVLGQELETLRAQVRTLEIRTGARG